MSSHSSDRQSDPVPPKPRTGGKAARFGLTHIIGGTAFLGVLTLAGTYIFGGFSGVGTGGIIALILGVTFSYALGIGLMVAVFYSSRFYDDDAHNAARDHFKDRHEGS